MKSEAALLDVETPVTECEPGGLSLGLLDRFVGFRTGRVNFMLARRFAAQMTEFQLKPGSFSALAMISANEGISQTALARVTGFDGASVVAIMDDFERRGWASRVRDPKDRRRHSLFITPEGEAALAQLHGIAKEIDQPLADVLSPQEFDQLRTLLDRVYGALMREAG